MRCPCLRVWDEAGPAALVISVQLCRLSGFGGPGTFAVVFLHIFIKLIALFGDDALTKIETVGGARVFQAAAFFSPRPCVWQGFLGAG